MTEKHTSKPSFEQFDYRLRPAKNIERKMFCDVFARLARIAPLRTYRYVGLGSIGFGDFTLLHQRLGISDMISIEYRKESDRRVAFNRPYACIKVRMGDSHDVLPDLKWERRSIVWLDYDKPLHAPHLTDLRLIAASARSGSVVIVTVPSDPGKFDGDTKLPQRRYDELTRLVGPDKIPADLKPVELAQWGLAKAHRRIIHEEILSTIRDRNGALSGDDALEYEQLFNFHYKDGMKMLSVGGVILNKRDRGLIGARHFRDLSFIKHGDDPYLIEAPVLTWRELRYLDSRMPKSIKSHPKWLPEEDRRRYRSVYRYFPNFLEVEV